MHAKHASQSKNRVIVQSPDTDAAVICTPLHSDHDSQELWFRTGVKDKLRYIPVLGRGVCDALPALHALTGCDSTSSLSGIGKKKAMKALLGNQMQKERLAEVGMDLAEKVYFKSQILVHECWTILDHF